MKRLAQHLMFLTLSMSAIHFCYKSVMHFSLYMDTTNKQSIEDGLLFGFNFIMMAIALATSALFATMMERDK